MSLHGDRTLQHSTNVTNVTNVSLSDESLNFSDMNTDIYKDYVLDAIKQFRCCGEQCDLEAILFHALMKNAQTFMKKTLVR